MNYEHCEHCDATLWERYYAISTDDFSKDVCPDCAREISGDLILENKDFSVTCYTVDDDDCFRIDNLVHENIEREMGIG